MKNITLLSHQWKAATRSAAASKSAGIKIFMGFIFFILFLELLGGGFYLGSELAENSENPILTYPLRKVSSLTLSLPSLCLTALISSHLVLL